MKTLIIEISTILTHLIGVYIIYNIITILGDDKKITLKNVFNPFREYTKKYGGFYFFMFCISLLLWVIFYAIYINIIQKYNFNIIW